VLDPYPQRHLQTHAEKTVKVVVDCPECGKQLRLSETHLGKEIRCPECAQWVVLPEVASSADETLASVPEANETQGERDTDLGAVESPQPKRKSRRGTTRKNIGRFELKAILDKGSFGKVYRAYDPVLDREVALKVPHAGTLENRTAAQRFLREAQAAAQLRHPCIVPVYDAGPLEGGYFIASSLVEGTTLEETLETGPFDFRDAAEIVKQLAQAVDYAHTQGVIHGGISPAEITVDFDGEPQLTNFGLRRTKKTDAAAARRVVYLSPEQLDDPAADIGPMADQYSLGVVFYELLCHRPPFSGPVKTIVKKIRNGEPRSPRSLEPSVTKDLEAVCEKAMAKDPDDRYPDCKSFGDDLDNWLKGKPVTAHRVGIGERFWLWSRRNPVAGTLCAVIACSLLLGGLVSSYFAIAASRSERAAALNLTRAEIARTEATSALEQAGKEERQAQVQEKAAQEAVGVATKAEASVATARTALQTGEKQQQRQKAASRHEDELRDEAERELELQDKRIDSAEQLIHTIDKLSIIGGDRLAVSGDGETLAVGDKGGSVELYNARTGWKLAEFDELKTHDRWLSHVVFSPDGERFATVGQDRGSRKATFFRRIKVWNYVDVIKLWNVKTRKCEATFKEHTGPISSLVFSPDGKLLASTGSDKSIRLWNLSTRRCLATLTEPRRVISNLAFSPDGKLLAAVRATTVWPMTHARESSISLWDVANKRPAGAIAMEEGTVQSIAFSPDGDSVASISAVAFGPKREKHGHRTHQRINLWDVKNGRNRVAYPQYSEERRSTPFLEFSPSGAILAAGARSGAPIRLWDAQTGRERATLRGHDKSLSSIAFSPDETFLNSRGVSNYRELELKRWHVASSHAHTTLREHTSAITSVAFSPKGQEVATGSRDRTIKIWNRNNSQSLRTLEGHKSFVFSVTYSPDGKVLASGGRDGEIVLWNTSNGEQRMVLPPQNGAVYAVAFSPNGQTLASAGDGINLWDANSGKPLAAFNGHSGYVHSVAFSPDGNLLASGSGSYGEPGELRLWDLKTQRERMKIDGHSGAIWTVAFSADGKTLASAGEEKVIRLWDVSSGQQRGSLKGHSQCVWRVAFASEQDVLASAGMDRTIRLWNAESRTQLAELTGHTSEVHSVMFSPDGKTLASGSWDKSLRLWDLTELLAHPSRGLADSLGRAKQTQSPASAR
jgi:WD40 repeat protein/tRNA A-37 threonylcarbamoyl transferase component Bud32/DNA-directed RNA polymerase subunit RPC12/RpoP